MHTKSLTILAVALVALYCLAGYVLVATINSVVA